MTRRQTDKGLGRMPIWRAALAAVLLGLVAAASVSSRQSHLPAANDWRVSNVVRAVDLGGTNTQLTDVYTLKGAGAGRTIASTDDEVPAFYFAFSQADASKLSGLEATARFGVGLKPEQRRLLAIRDEGLYEPEGAATIVDSNGTDARPHLYSVQLPAAFLKKDHPDEQLPDTTITITANTLHASEPLPRSIAQTDTQYLLWHGDGAILTPYGAESARIRIKAPQAQVLSYDTEPDLGADLMTKSGGTVTLGPFKNVPSMLRSNTAAPAITRASVHYQYNMPMLTTVDAKREAKVSHWRNRLSVHDDYWLQSSGALLKGHFSRIAHQQNVMFKREATHMVQGIAINLPPGADGAYFVDESGNVSTSHFRPAPPSPESIGTPVHLLTPSKASLLELSPRYPLLGGWNYTCSVGWNVRLSDGWRQALAGSRHLVQVPFMTTARGLAVDRASLRVVLPEGARDIAVKLPFDVDAQGRSKSWGFLDTTGKPVVELSKSLCSERHGGLVGIEYTLTPLDHYRKVVVAALLAVLGVLTLIFGSKVDLSIEA